MLRAKEKAKELIFRFSFSGDDLQDCKNYALVCIEEIIEFINVADYAYIEDDVAYWKEVEEEIKLYK